MRVESIPLCWLFISLCCPHKTQSKSDTAYSIFAQSVRVYKHSHLLICMLFQCFFNHTRILRDTWSIMMPLLTVVMSSLHTDLKDIYKGLQCLLWWHHLPVFNLSEAYHHNSDVIPDISDLIGYHDQSGPAPSDALFPVAQWCPSFHTWEYWESVWDAREWWEGSSAFQTWMDVESILSAWGVHREWPSICRQGKLLKHNVCRGNYGGFSLLKEYLMSLAGDG